LNFCCDNTTGKKYDISHLEQHKVEYVQVSINGKPERRYSVEVSYSNHCYTKRLDNIRIFDIERYKQSKLLPRIIAELMTRECHHTGKTNFVTLDIDANRTYEVYFEMFKKVEKLYMRVQSAYIRDKNRLSSQPRRAKIRFSTILFNVLHDKPIHPPQRKKQ
jgi:hypothetical protein